MKRLILLALTLAIAVAVLAIPAFAATRSVCIRDDYFSPRSVTINKGSTIRWVWRGHSRHNVAVSSGPVHFRSGLHRTGTYRHRFGRRGTYRIVCTVHTGMRMTVRVR
jgi:plastocyanin